MNRLILSVAALGLSASAASAQLYNELISGDLSNFPAPTLLFPMAPGVNFVARGIMATNQVDVDFISILVPFNCTQLLFDLDHLNTPLEDSVLGAGPHNLYPNPILFSDDDNDGPLDTICGHATTPRDSLIDVGTLLGVNPIPAGSYTIAIGRQGEQSVGWNGTAGLQMKLEYQLYVYALPVPAPSGIAVLGAIGAWGLRRRRA